MRPSAKAARVSREFAANATIVTVVAATRASRDPSGVAASPAELASASGGIGGTLPFALPGE